MKILFIDFDGTLFNHQREVDPRDIELLSDLGNNGIIRVIATGRSLYSLNRVIPPDFPADYILFSSGAGVYDRNSGEHIYGNAFKGRQVEEITALLKSMDVDFMIQYPIPDNHKFLYHATRTPHPDFLRRCSIYDGHCKPLGNEIMGEATQFIVIVSDGDGIIRQLGQYAGKISIILATSPLDHSSAWVEIFPEQVSKGKTAAWLCGRLGIHRDDTLGIGNDYNDVDLLEFTARSFVTPDAPDILRKRFRQAGSGSMTPLMEALQE